MISIIIPTLNEEQALAATLERCRQQRTEHEIIVVDGGSDDRTLDIAKSVSGVKVLKARQGRASQMNVGACFANGDWLLFLHADTLLPDDALDAIARLDSKSSVRAGGFHHQFSGQHWLLKLISRLHNWRFAWTGVLYGDQAMFVHRQLFDRVGGFPETDVLEDVIFCERALEFTQPVLLPLKVITDSRKFEQRGIVRSFLDVLLIQLCHILHLPVMPRGFFAPVR